MLSKKYTENEIDSLTKSLKIDLKFYFKLIESEIKLILEKAKNGLTEEELNKDIDNLFI